MRLQYPFLLGAGLGIGGLSLLWAGIVWQFGTVANGLRYLRGYNYTVYPTTIDVGAGERGEKRTTTAMVRNLSFSPIRVIGVLTTCNCGVVTGLPLTIGPRQTEELQFIVYLQSSSGEVEQTATVLIDDGQMQRTRVTITGRCGPAK
jgi:hypothetical protein